MKTNIKSLVLVLTGSIYGFVLFFSSICSAASYPTTTATPLAADLSMNQYKLNDVGDIITKGPWVDARAYASINAAITDIGANEKTLLITNNQTLTAALTVPSNVTLDFLHSGKITLGNYNLTINGPLQAPLKKIFDYTGTGVVTFGKKGIVFPDFWGENTTPGVTDMTSYIQSALNTGCEVHLISGITYLTDTINATVSGTRITGGGKLQLKTAGGIILRIRADRVEVDHLHFIGKDTINTYEVGIYCHEIYHKASIHNCDFTALTIAIDVNGSDFGTFPYGWSINDNLFYSIGTTSGPLYGYGVLLVNCMQMIVSNNVFKTINRHAIYLSAGTRHSVISGNVIDGVTSAAAILLSAVTGQNTSSDNIITDNTILNTVIAIQANEYSHFNIISNNKIKKCSDTAIFVSNDGGAFSSRYPIGNIIHDNDFQSEGVTFVNLIRMNDSDGTYVYNNTGNVTSSGGSAGALIKVDNSSSTYTAASGFVARIFGNRFRSDTNVSGIRIDYASATQPVIIGDNEFPGITLETEVGGTWARLKRVQGTFINKNLPLNRTIGTVGTRMVMTDEYYIGVTTTTGARTVTLPPAATVGTGKIYIIKDESGGAGTNNITIDANGTETIDGSLTLVINANYGKFSIISDGSNWFTF